MSHDADCTARRNPGEPCGCQPATARPHDYECEPFSPPYGIRWRCRRPGCGHTVVQSLTVLADPERLRSTAAALDVPCSSRSRASRTSPTP